MLQDCHAHFQAVDDIEGMKAELDGLSKNNVGRVLCNATSPEDWPALSSVVSGRTGIAPFYGVHPWFADKVRPGWEEELVRRADAAPSGIGEIGLDRSRTGVDFSRQEDVFAKQLDIAYDTGRPFTIHCVDAWGELVKALKERGKLGPKFMVHSFSGSVETMEEVIKLGGYISFSLKILEKRYKKISEAFEAVPLDRMLLETDFPYAPGSVSKSPAKPGDYFDCINRLYEAASRIKAVEPAILEKAVWDNGTVLMHRASPGQG